MRQIEISKTTYRIDKGNVVVIYNIETKEFHIANLKDKIELKDLEDLSDVLDQLLKYIKNL